ncbi:transposase [Streptomyces werraensis]
MGGPGPRRTWSWPTRRTPPARSAATCVKAYKQRNTVERCINRLKQRRGLATRYDKTAPIYLAGLHIAARGPSPRVR